MLLKWISHAVDDIQAGMSDQTADDWPVQLLDDEVSPKLPAIEKANVEIARTLDTNAQAIPDLGLHAISRHTIKRELAHLLARIP